MKRLSALLVTLAMILQTLLQSLLQHVQQALMQTKELASASLVILALLAPHQNHQISL